MSDSATPWTVAHQAPLSMEFSGKTIGVGCHFFLQGIFPTQGLNLGLVHCRQTLYPLSHQQWPISIHTHAHLVKWNKLQNNVYGVIMLCRKQTILYMCTYVWSVANEQRELWKAQQPVNTDPIRRSRCEWLALFLYILQLQCLHCFPGHNKHLLFLNLKNSK